MRTRLRDAYSPEELARIYADPYVHTRWHEHVLRTEMLVSLGHWLLRGTSLPSVADLSAGDGKLAERLASNPILGDLVDTPGYEHHGPIEDTMQQIPPVTLFILSETLEHLDDPDAVLAYLRTKAELLLVSTPIGLGADADNPEHYWAWYPEDVAKMLELTGWQPAIYNELSFTETDVTFQLWGCR